VGLSIEADSRRFPTVNITVTLAPEQLDVLAGRVADVLEERRDDGFVTAEGAADYLGHSRKALYALVERGRIPHHRPAGRLLFDRRELRAWVERS
jgi:excisionase family DNA binding protein